MIDKKVEKANRISKNSKIREEAPTRKSKRARHAPAEGQGNSNIYSLVNGSIYCENDDDLDKYYLGEGGNESLDLLSKSKNTSPKQGIKRRRKLRD